MKTKLYARESVAFDEVLVLRDRDGAAVDITEWTFEASFARQAGSTDFDLATASAGSQGFAVVDGEGGVLRMRIDQTTLAGIEDTTGNTTMFADLLGTAPGGEQRFVADLRLNVSVAGEDFSGTVYAVVLDAVAASVAGDLQLIVDQAEAARNASIAIAETGTAVETRGSSSAPVAGTAKLTNGTYLFNQVVTSDPIGATVKGYNDSGSAGSIKLKVGTDNGTTFTVAGEVTVAVTTGAFEVTLDAAQFADLAPAAGQKLAVWTGGVLTNSDSRLTYTASAGASETPYWFASGDASSVTTSGAATSGNRLELQVLFDYAYVTSARVQDIESDLATTSTTAEALSEALLTSETVGRPAGTPVTGTPVSTASYFSADRNVRPGFIRKVYGFNPQASSKQLLIRKASSDGSVATTLATITVPGSAGSPFSLDLVDDCGLSAYPEIGANEYIGFHPGAATFVAGAADNSVAYTVATADGAGHYSNGQSSPTSTTGFTPGTPTTSSRLQIGFEFDYYPDLSGVESPVRGKFERVANRLRAHYEAARKGNPRTLGVMSSPPTVTVSASAPSSPYVAFPSSVSSAGSFSPYVRTTGGWVGYSGGYIFPLAVTRTIGAVSGGGSGQSYQGAHRLIWFTGEAVHTFLFKQSRLVKHRLLVNGEYVDLAGFTATAVDTLNYVTIDFGSADRDGRKIEFEIQGGPNNAVSTTPNLTQFKGWYKAPTGTIWAGAPGMRVGVFGDSLTFGPIDNHIGTGLSQLADSFARQIGDRLGVDDLMQSGLSGTGWLWQSGGGFPNLYQRVTDITTNAVDVAVIAMGANDIFNFGSTNSEGITISAATIQARVTLTLQAIRAARPELPIVVLGPFTNASTIATTNQAAVEAAISAGVTACADPLIAFRPLISTGFMTGTGTVAATTGDGIADWARVADGTHWTLDGHGYAGNRLAGEVIAGFEAIRAALA